MAGILATTLLTKEWADYLRVIRNSRGVLLYIIDDDLDFAKIEANKINNRESFFDLQILIHEIEWFFHSKDKENRWNLLLTSTVRFLETCWVIQIASSVDCCIDSA